MTTYVIDADHSTLGFTIRHAGIGKTRGQFDEFNGTIEVADDSTPTGSTASATIKAASVNTRNNDRDNHLRSADFFDVETYPEWTFATTGVSGSKESFTLTGDLTIHGVTKSVDLEVEFLGAATASSWVTRSRSPWRSRRSSRPEPAGGTGVRIARSSAGWPPRSARARPAS